MKKAPRNKWILTLTAWSAALVLFFPILWMLLTGFKSEVDAIAAPPRLIFKPTLENFVAVQQRASYLKYAGNSIVLSLGSTALGLMLAIPAAYAMAFFPTRRTKDTLLWMMSTRMLPPVGVLVPIYLLFRDSGLLDSRSGLVLIYTVGNLPVMVWMLFSFFREIPREILEAARIDGAGPVEEVWYLLLPLSLPGIASTALLSIILAWNEAFWSLNLTAANAGPLTSFMASFSSPEGLFWAKLSAASTLAIAPVLILGWMNQKQLARGLTFGAVK